MNKIEFISHEHFPEDEYTKELVYLCIEGKFRVAYIRKNAKNGGLFWAPASIGIMKNGAKQYFAAFMQDSNFLEKDIKDYLEGRKWESSKGHATDSQRYAAVNQASDGIAYPRHMQPAYQHQISEPIPNDGDLPF